MRLYRLVLVPLLCTACAQLPAINEDYAVKLKDTPYPDFIPLAELPQPDRTAQIRIETNTVARVARTKAKANNARGPVLTPAERAKLTSRTRIIRGQVLSPSERARLLSRS